LIHRIKITALINMFSANRFFLLDLILISSNYLTGQPTHVLRADPVKLVFYYNVNWELTTPEKSFFTREAYFDLQEMVFDGVYQDYNKDHKLIAEGYYAHGVKSGIQTEHFDDQSIKSTIEFSNDDFIIWQLVNDKKEYQIVKGTGKFTTPYFYFFDFYLKQGTLHGEFQNGKRSGAWNYFDLKKNKTDVEYYDKGKLIKRTSFTKTDSMQLHSKKEIILSVSSIYAEALIVDKDAFATVNQYFETQVTHPASFQRNVTYAGGLKHLLRLLTQAEVPDRNLALIKIKINEHAQVLKSIIVRSVDPDTDERVLKVLEQHASRFMSAMKDGKPYATTIYLPVSGGEQWEKMLNEMPAEWFLDVNNFTN